MVGRKIVFPIPGDNDIPEADPHRALNGTQDVRPSDGEALSGIVERHPFIRHRNSLAPMTACVGTLADRNARDYNQRDDRQQFQAQRSQTPPPAEGDKRRREPSEKTKAETGEEHNANNCQAALETIIGGIVIKGTRQWLIFALTEHFPDIRMRLRRVLLNGSFQRLHICPSAVPELWGAGDRHDCKARGSPSPTSGVRQFVIIRHVFPGYEMTSTKITPVYPMCIRHDLGDKKQGGKARSRNQTE